MDYRNIHIRGALGMSIHGFVFFHIALYDDV